MGDTEVDSIGKEAAAKWDPVFTEQIKKLLGVTHSVSHVLVFASSYPRWARRTHGPESPADMILFEEENVISIEGDG